MIHHGVLLPDAPLAQSLYWVALVCDSVISKNVSLEF